MSAFIKKICCGLAGMGGWKHTVKPDGSHLWWWKTTHHALGVIVWPDVAGAPLYVWKVRRLADGNEIEGACHSVAGGTTLAVDHHTRWLELDAKRAATKRAPKTLPAEDQPVPF